MTKNSGKIMENGKFPCEFTPMGGKSRAASESGDFFDNAHLQPTMTY